jgi:hypothetical protein
VLIYRDVSERNFNVYYSVTKGGVAPVHVMGEVEVELHLLSMGTVQSWPFLPPGKEPLILVEYDAGCTLKGCPPLSGIGVRFVRHPARSLVDILTTVSAPCALFECL